MSTKIFDAYMVREKTDHIFRTLAFDLRPAIRNHAERVLRAAMIQGGDPWAMAERIEEAMLSGLREPLNQSFSAVIFPKPRFCTCSYDGDWSLVQFYGVERDHERIIASFIRRHDWRDFHYQNSGDRPKCVTKKDWETRKHIWDKVFEETRTPYEAGMVVEIVNEDWASRLPWRIGSETSSLGSMHPRCRS